MYSVTGKKESLHLYFRRAEKEEDKFVIIYHKQQKE